MNHTPDLIDVLENVEVSEFENLMFLRPESSLNYFGLGPENIYGVGLKTKNFDLII